MTGNNVNFSASVVKYSAKRKKTGKTGEKTAVFIIFLYGVQLFRQAILSLPFPMGTVIFIKTIREQMNTILKHTLSACTAAMFAIQAYGADDPVDLVNPLCGTDSKFELSTGNTYPATALPWGMNFWTPQTGTMGDGWIYTYNADKIRGFRQTHQPSPWMNDYGQFAIMPATGEPAFDQDSRASWFSHKAETAKPYYYKVYLADHDVTAELTPTERAAFFRFTYPEEESSYVVIDAFDNGSYIKVIPSENKVVGYSTRNSGGVPDNFRNWFVIEFDKPFEFFHAVKDGEILSGKDEAECGHAGAIVGFSTARGETIHAKVASSFISLGQAETNLREIGERTFDEVAADGRKIWNRELGKIEVEDDDVDNLRTFYSCLYRCLLFPRAFHEIDRDGNTVHYSPYNGKVCPGYMFTDTGFWDTFRSLFPLLNLMYPSMGEKMQEGLVNAWKESGFLPEWASPGHRDCMVGNNSASVVADAYIKGLEGYDIEALWEAVKHGTASQLKGTASGRVGYEEYNRLGYVPNNVGIGQNAARTLEYAYDDWAIYTLGKKLGKPESEIAVFGQRAMNYRNIYDPARKLMAGRDDKGHFSPDFDPVDWSGDFCEGNSWHWSFCVFHDPKGLMDLMGGKDEFNRMMDSVFVIPGRLGMESRGMIHEMREMQVMDMGQYAHGNQPIQHMVYLYNWSGQPWKAQYRTREIMEKLYSPTPDCYCGDEDNGQTSAWYVFSALGFYPVCPGTDQYIIGSPLFRSARLHLENGKTVTISAKDNGKGRCYIQKMKVNGKEWNRNYLTHSSLLEGPDITFSMSDRPEYGRGTSEEAAPYSFSDSGLPDWTIGEFVRPEGANPVISPDEKSKFLCPMTGKPVAWESNDTFNPAAAVHDGKIVLLYRAEDKSGEGIGRRTSRLGYAESRDGIKFKRESVPVFYPDEDAQKEYEWPGGCEDPRIAVTEDGLYVMFYTQWNRRTPRLAVATSRDLRNWTKHGPAFAMAFGGKFLDMGCKSASILTEIAGDRQVIKKVDGQYFMYWGEENVHAATSGDLVNWTPVTNADGSLRILFSPRDGYFDSQLTECGPPAIYTPDGIVLLYNGKNSATKGDSRYTPNVYAAGQALFSADDPLHFITRLDEPFFVPTEPFEKSGQYKDGTVFIEGMAWFKGKWFLYYGCADSKVGVAISK